MSTVTDYLPQAGTVPCRVVAYLHTLPREQRVPTALLSDLLEQPSSTIISSMGAAVMADLVVREKADGRISWGRGRRVLPAEWVNAHAPQAKPEPAPVFDPPPAPRLRAPVLEIDIDAVHHRQRTVDVEAREVPAAPRFLASDVRAAQARIAADEQAALLEEALESAGEPESSPAASPIGTADTPAPGPREAAPQAPDQPGADFAALAEGEPWPREEAEESPEEAEQRRAAWRATLAELDDIAAKLQLAGPFRAALWSTGELELRRGDSMLVTLSVTETRELCDYLDRVLVEGRAA